MTRSALKLLALKGGVAAGAACALAWATQANAQQIDDRYWLEIQAFWPDIDTTVAVSSADGARGTSIDLESDLDLRDRKSLPAFYAGARIGDRWSVVGEFYVLDRSGSTSISRELTFDGATFDAGATVASQFDTDVYRVAVGYSFVRNEKADLGVAAGLHVTQFTVGLQGQAHVGAAAVQSETRKRDALAPLPTVGAFGSYQVAPKVVVGGRIDYLSLKVSDYDGRLINAQASVTYRLFKNIGVGALYRYVDYELGIEKDRWNGDIAYSFKGPALFLQAAF